MKIFNKDISLITFDDVVNHCKERIPEGIELDYKRDYPSGLAKLIAAFSNTRGGLIIIGVEEDEKSGCPVKWDGLAMDAKLVEKAYQQVSSVTPLPDYRVAMTNPSDGNVFILIRVYEGDATPYYVINDPNIWQRTGSIRKLIEIASPEWQELLFRKKDRADKARANYINIAENIYINAVELEAKCNHKKHINDQIIGVQKDIVFDDVLFKIMIQPNFPNLAKVNPKDLMINLKAYSARTDFLEFPNNDLKPIPNGVMSTILSANIAVSHQVYSVGLIYNCQKISPSVSDRVIYINNLLGILFTMLLSARNLYRYIDYQGVIKMNMSLDLKSKDIFFQRIRDRSETLFPSDLVVPALSPSDSWTFTMNTSDLNDSKSATDLFIKIAEEVHWDLGFAKVNENIIRSYLQEFNLNF